MWLVTPGLLPKPGVEKTVQDTVAETEVALDKAMEATSDLKKEDTPTVEV
jgi:hypothetical protein